ncbi:type III secretion system (T3SS) SseB-like protein [Murinocardiopsis flavida]|uniref:Type III secretion system (T3SS) SseB-like protein n=1 Tax=Murinocardiopsis flavida TaxID=645275 RepID=A0A2P8DHM7_9ACTN|nr:SseB family protein [Murinocardiopsis flavida]PSK96727.1 type III secretion system (T3SS) SseB-like protein [Murinocardiopsis flavida]
MSSNDGPAADGGEFPANTVEEALARALEQTRGEEAADDAPGGAPGGASESPEEAAGAVAGFITALRDGDLWVPLPEGSGVQDDGSIALPTLDLEGSPFIPVFTSEGQLGERSAELPYTVIPARELAGVLPEGVGLALNPGNEPSVPLYPETVEALSGG